MKAGRWLGFCVLVSAATVSAGEPVADFALVDHRGQPWSWQQTRGKVVLVAFGYTSCPDVCPLTLSLVAQTLKLLGAEAIRVAPLFISVDAERDRPETLARYVEYFDPRITGLTGSAEQVAAAAARFNVRFKAATPAPGGTYTVEHTANIYIVDPRGAIRASVPFGFPADHVAGVIQGVLDR